MKILIVYYSRTGANEKIAKGLKEKLLDADIEKIIDKTIRLICQRRRGLLYLSLTI